MAAQVILGIASLLYSVYAQEQARKQSKKSYNLQEEQIRVQERQANVSAVRSRREAIRRARVARAEAVAAGAQSGARTESSGIYGGVTGIGSQFQGQMSFLDTQQALGSRANILAAGAAGAQGRAASYQAQAQLAGSIFSNTPQIASIFNSLTQ